MGCKECSANIPKNIKCSGCANKDESSESGLNGLVMPLGMTKTPEGWPVMADAFLSFAFYAIGKPEIVEEFENKTGNKFDSITGKTGIESMIDKATGHRNAVLAKFMDWLVVTHWGEEA